MTVIELETYSAPSFELAPADDIVAEDEWIWIAVGAAIVLFGGVAAACRIACWGTPKRCTTTWYGYLDVQCR